MDHAPETASDWNELGNHYLRTRSVEKAIEAYKQAILLEPSFGSPYSNLGTIYYQKGQYKVAVQLYRRSVDLLTDPEDKAMAWNRLGDAYRRLDDHTHAMEAYSKANELKPASNSILTRARFSLLDHSMVRSG
jgi:tetratricopeptide (TPR) repeat protein